MVFGATRVVELAVESEFTTGVGTRHRNADREDLLTGWCRAVQGGEREPGQHRGDELGPTARCAGRREGVGRERSSRNDQQAGRQRPHDLERPPVASVDPCVGTIGAPRRSVLASCHEFHRRSPALGPFIGTVCLVNSNGVRWVNLRVVHAAETSGLGRSTGQSPCEGRLAVRLSSGVCATSWRNSTSERSPSMPWWLGVRARKAVNVAERSEIADLIDSSVTRRRFVQALDEGLAQTGPRL